MRKEASATVSGKIVCAGYLQDSGENPRFCPMKIARLGVVVDRGEKSTRSTTTTAKLVFPAELPSIEEELKVLVAVLKGWKLRG